MKLNYRHNLESINKQLKPHSMRFTCIAESSNKQSRSGLTFILKEINKETGDMTQTCGYFYTASDAVEFVNNLNKGILI